MSTGLSGIISTPRGPALSPVWLAAEGLLLHLKARIGAVFRLALATTIVGREFE